MTFEASMHIYLCGPVLGVVVLSRGESALGLFPVMTMLAEVRLHLEL